MEPLIINAAISGSSPPDASPHLPRSPEDIGKMAVEVWRAGASIVHIHARDDDGRPTGDPAYFQRVMDVIRDAGSDILVNLTTSYSAANVDDHELRLGPVRLRPHIASFDAGTMNFHEHVFHNTPTFLRRLAREMLDHDVKPEIEIFDVGMILNAQRLAAEGLLKGPLFFQFVLGVRGGAPADARNLSHLVESLPPGAVWSVTGIGRHQLPMDTLAVVMGGHARTGLEDNLYYDKGDLATNARLVERVAGLARTLGRPVATPAQAREILGISRGPLD